MTTELSFTPLITEIEIKHRIDSMARAIAAVVGTESFILVSILKGAFIFTADIIRNLHQYGARPQTDFIRASSYGVSDVSSGEVRIAYDISLPLEGKDVLLIDDICDTGRTMALLKDYLAGKGAARVMTCVLMDKPSRREVDFNPDFIGFEIPDKFVVGYGLDFAERYRDLPFIAVVDTNSLKG